MYIKGTGIKNKAFQLRLNEETFNNTNKMAKEFNNNINEMINAILINQSNRYILLKEKLEILKENPVNNFVVFKKNITRQPVTYNIYSKYLAASNSLLFQGDTNNYVLNSLEKFRINYNTNTEKFFLVEEYYQLDNNNIYDFVTSYNVGEMTEFDLISSLLEYSLEWEAPNPFK